MEYIQVTKENIEKEHICCAISNNKDAQVSSKKAWLADRFDDGLVFLKSTERGKCFIEYIPAENAWNPIDADGYMYINCLWVSGSFKGHGYSNDLLSACISDSKEKGKKGLCILCAAKKKPFLAVHLEETVLRRGLKLQIGTKQAILKYSMSEDEYLYKMTEALARFGLKGGKTGNGNIPPLQEPETPAPKQQEPAAKPSGYTLSPEARMRMERTMNAEVRDIEFEWIGSTLKGFHGIQKRVTVPIRASRIMSHAFSGLPVEYIVLHKGISKLDFAAFNKCSNLKQVIIESPQMEIGYLDDPVSPIGAFYQCPQAVVYCHRDSEAYEELKRTHNGEIRFIEDMEGESSS